MLYGHLRLASLDQISVIKKLTMNKKWNTIKQTK